MADKGKNTVQVKVPDIGDFSDVEIIEVLVAVGDQLNVEDPLITIETDKAAMDVPSPAAGVVKALQVKNGDRVSEGTLILELETATVATADAPQAAAADNAAGAKTKKAKKPAKREAAPLQVVVPDIGDFSDVEIIEVLVTAGEVVSLEQGLITLETEKAAMDVPAPAAGKILSLAVKQGDRVSKGDLVLTMLPSGAAPAKDATADSAAAEAASEAGSAEAPAQAAIQTEHVVQSGQTVQAGGQMPPIDEAGFAKAHASPSVRRFARELGVDLTRVSGSGLKGRITHENVKAFVKAVMSGGRSGGEASLPKVPVVDFSKFGEIDYKSLLRIKKIASKRLQASWLNLPHVTQHDEADITDLEKTRAALKPRAKKEGVKLTPLAFFIKACMQALIEFPEFNASLDPDGEQLILKKYYHIGFAADTPNGLVVPVIRDVNSKGVFEIASELGDLAQRARDGKLKAAEMQGGCFTVSSLGGIGGTAFTPIINAPEVAILGISRSRMQPVWDGKEFLPRLMLPLSLSYDHRVIDGAAAARFTTFLGEVLRDVRDLTP